MTETTPTGLPIVDCDTCGNRHPVTWGHCAVCGLATLFGHEGCCACPWVPEKYWTTHYGAVEPGSQREFNPECPIHGRDAP